MFRSRNTEFALVFAAATIITTASFSFRYSDTQSHSISIRLSSAANNFIDMDDGWLPLSPSRLDIEPVELARRTPQLAKDEEYAAAVQQAWKEEVKDRTKSQIASESKSIVYQDEDGLKLYGHLIRRKGSPAKNQVPGIIFFHTGAGPHDVCLHWKADSLVTNEDVFPDGCIILVADILSDDCGWAWYADRTRYNHERENLMKAIEGNDGSVSRPLLRKRIQAAVDTIKSIDGVDSTRLSAMGWCLGGNPVLELARMTLAEIKFMASFHGVFGSVSPPPKKSPLIEGESSGHVLICNGAEDPFVAKGDLQNTVDVIKGNGYGVTLLQLAGAKHGFTNPAQDFNPNENFRFNKAGAHEAWKKTLELLKGKL